MMSPALVGCFLLTLTGAQTIRSTTAIGQLSGRVLDDTTYQPLADARVFLYRVPFQAGGRARLAVSNQDGEFVFDAVEPGSYTLGTNKLGYFPAPDAAWPSVDVAPGGVRAGVDLLMSKGAVLTGRLVDDAGKPLRDASVGALRAGPILRLDQTIGSVVVDRTNENGEFRVQSLRPGRYAVVAYAPNRVIGTAGNGTTDSMTFFPGTLDLAHATLVTVEPGATVGGLEFKMIVAPSFEVTGIVIDERGQPVSEALVAVDADWPLFGGPKGSGRTDADGRFRIGLLAVGDYALTVTNRGDETKTVTRKTPFVRLTVIDADVNGLIIQVPIR